MPSALVTRAAVGDESIDQPTTPAGEYVEHDGAVDLAFACGMFGDVGDPQPVGLVAPKAALHEIRRGRDVGDPSEAGASGDAGDSGAAHQQLDRAVTDGHAVTQDELSLHAARAIGAAAVLVDAADDLGQERVPDRPRRWRTINAGRSSRTR